LVVHRIDRTVIETRDRDGVAAVGEDREQKVVEAAWRDVDRENRLIKAELVDGHVGAFEHRQGPEVVSSGNLPARRVFVAEFGRAEDSGTRRADRRERRNNAEKVGGGPG